MYSGVERGSDTFIWSVGDALGNGATGTVYKCRDKKKGKPFAAKVLNANSQLRPYDVQMRETEVLSKLSHPNIVQLFALEKERGSQATVIIMELCGRSLYDIIEEPENMNGLSDQDFIEVIRDISSGMEYLKANNVVHRDVKPGNILRSEKENGMYIYKITDFGTARELGNTEQFVSFAYGTEEYLHPDLYERAVMRMSKSKTFNSTVDLWSLGVTFYHLATGELPFQPLGGRQNKDVMFRMITEKRPGIISCHENANTNKLVYSDRLPNTTQISQALKRLITPVLQGLLETNPEYMISHDDFFKTIRNIVERKAFDVYFTKTSLITRLYLQQEDNFAHLHEVLSTELGVDVTDQCLLYDFQEFKPDPMTPILHYPEITAENPLILDTKNYMPAIDIPVKKIPIIQITPKGSNFDDDAKLARLYSCLSYSIKRDTDMLFLIQKAILKAHNTLDFNAQIFFKAEKAYCDNLLQRTQDKWKHLTGNNQHLIKLHKAKNSHLETLLTEDDKQKFCTVIQILSKLESEFTDIFDNKVLMEEWDDTGDCLKLLPWDDVIVADVKNIKAIFLKFMDDRRRQIKNLDELAHRHDKERLSTCYQRLQSQHASVAEHRNKLHDKFVKWLLLLHGRKNTVVSLKDQLVEEVTQFEQIYTKKLSDFETSVNTLLSQCSHDFKKLEDELVELDCIPDLLSMVYDQGEKLKMLQEIDAQENSSINSIGLSL